MKKFTIAALAMLFFASMQADAVTYYFAATNTAKVVQHLISKPASVSAQSTYTERVSTNEMTQATEGVYSTSCSPAGTYYNITYEVLKTGYSCAWYTLAQKSTTFNVRDLIASCTASLNNSTMTISTNELAKAQTAGSYTVAYAALTPNKYQVTFDKNASRASCSTTSSTVTFDSAYGEGTGGWPEPSRDGYTFNGWYTLASGGSAVSSATIVSTAANHTLYAQWTAIPYSITFNGNGADGGSMSSVDLTDKYETTVTLPANEFTRTGYKFSGWSTSASSTKVTYQDESSASGDKFFNDGDGTVLYAVWEAIGYTLSINNNGGSGESSVAVTYGDFYGAVNPPTLAGADFQGYFTQADGQGDMIWDSKGQPCSNAWVWVKADVPQAIAYWSYRDYTIMFDANGGEGSVASTNGTIDAEITMPAVSGLTYEGHSCDGWALSAGSTSMRYAPGSTVSIRTIINDSGSSGSEITLYAHWSEVIYSLTIAKTGEGFGSVTPSSGSYKSGTVVTLEATPITGSDFKGWSDGDTTNPRMVTMTSDLSLTADFELHVSMVTLDLNGGDTISSNKIYVTYSKELPELPEPERTGYTFTGWYTDVSGGRLMEEGSECTLTSDDTWYARWKAHTYTIQFDGNGKETGTMSKLSMTYDVENTLTANRFSRTEYDFLGWAYDSSSTAIDFADQSAVKNLTDVNGTNIVLYAIWQAHERYVVFNGNGNDAGGPMEMEIFRADETKALTSNVYSRTGYTFAGWAQNVSEAATLDVHFADGETLDYSLLPNSDIGATNELFAVWTPNHYTVKFDVNGGSGTMADQEFVYDVQQRLRANNDNIIASNPSLYSFIGWAKSKTATAAEYTDHEPVVNLTAAADGVVTLYAVWQADVGDYSRALDCSNLKFDAIGDWQVRSSSDAHCGTSYVEYVYDETVEASAELSTTGITGAGELSFWIRPAAYDLVLNVYTNGTLMAKVGRETVGGWDENTWVECRLTLTGAGTFSFVPDTDTFWDGDSLQLDCVTWAPGGSEKPEPTEADAPVISAAAVSADGGTFSLTFPASSKFKYQLQYNDTLSSDGWADVTDKSAVIENDGDITFEPAIDDSVPRRFYRVRVLQKD